MLKEQTACKTLQNSERFVGNAEINDKVQKSKLFIAQPDNIKMLRKEGDNLYAYDNMAQLKNIDESDAVVQGFIEKSNVNAVEMMTQMIETNRLVEMYQKAMSSQMDDMNNDAINKIARKA